MKLPSEPAALERLHALGVPRPAARLYLALLSDPAADPSSLAEVGGPDLDDDLRSLERLGLARESGLHASGVELSRPDRAMTALARIRRRELLRAEESLAAVDPLIDELQGAFDRSRPDAAGADRVELLETSEQVQVAIGNILQTATTELCALHPGPTSATRHYVPQRDLALLARGVSIRSVYGPRYLEEPGAPEAIEELMAAGEDARSAAISMTRMLIVDASTVVLPPTTDTVPRPGAIIVRSLVVVNACQALFEQTWADATPLSGRRDGEEDDGRRLLTDLLAAGLHDEAVARRLGVSVRTVRRRIRALMDELGCASRVQLGVRLAQRGMVASPDDGAPGG